MTSTPTETRPKIGRRKPSAKVLPTTPVVEEVPLPVVPVIEPTPVVPEPVVEETTTEEVVDEVEEISMETQLLTLKDLVNTTVKDLSEKMKVFRTIEHDLKKLSVVALKEAKKNKKNKKAKKLSSLHGFNAEVKISTELAEYLSIDPNGLYRPPQISSLFSNYAKANGLKDETNKAIYKPDAKTLKLLGPLIFPIKKANPELGNGVSIFNLNSYLKPHFTRIPVTPTTTA
jgi:chromatin remodeling complex protein RSC6